ncbi:chromosome segregation protein SMC [Bacillus safensis]|uniref:chromosome segregation protein SMC n=1 Tax=Bacillus safensis TaxID=561879 RepID=UPI00228044F8|nr:chromosome segregation protein SMC [Bacillus safensis]MCY7566285.1 chromosome segregation protein SMC [Bacillus safensis]MCY7624586.1 chromosome segregation protein SMC [Bacillus safensis]MCY7631647.1 chromosome segregation protein SMC [Bacillus safensis]MCY7647930.1 chromosome segregation protein SMC [Bacillus safensis]MCY7653327.1 chromosome segregation protein SMC [Bacillus safensis]
MIPWRLSFHGIRDYRPEQIDLAGADQHILISGPNGSGKSTITYCLGAVLYSSKVDLEGLKSRNLLPDETWKAKISIVFQNEGPMKIDVAKFIQFTLNIVQESGQLLKREYTISTGEEIDEWENTITYTSGGGQFNFSSYKETLLYKYKIDPDAYYLIWYQQDVNQFATMNPEERFRVFSEMHGISQMQQEWEESIERLKESKEALDLTKHNVNNSKLSLDISKQRLYLFNQNQERLKTGGMQYIRALLLLENVLKKEQKLLEDLIDQLETDYEEINDKIQLEQAKFSECSEGMNQLLLKQEKLEVDIEAGHEEISLLKEKKAKKSEEIAIREEELKDITEQERYIRHTEQEVKTNLVRLKEEIDHNTYLLSQMMENEVELKEIENQLRNEIAALKFKIEQDEKNSKKMKELLNEYLSSYDVSMRIDQLNLEIKKLKDEQFTLSKDVEELEKEHQLLMGNQELSQRQKQSLSYFRNKNVKAFPLRELVELDEQAQLKDEQLFDAIKYTIFFQGKKVEPPNDLYHVSLMNIVPDRSITFLPALHLKVKEGVRDEFIPHAIKALWWVEQFFKHKTIHIKNGYLYDEMGIRGSQEKDRLILSETSLQARKKEVDQQLKIKKIRCTELEREMNELTIQLQNLHHVISSVKEAEAFMSKEYEREDRTRQLTRKEKELSGKHQQLKQLDQERHDLNNEKAKLNNDYTLFEREGIFYEELGKRKEKYQEFKALQQQLADIEGEYERCKKKTHNLEEELDTHSVIVKKHKRAVEALEDDLQHKNREKEDISRRLKEKQVEIDRMKQELVGYMQEIMEIKKYESQFYSEATQERFPDQTPSINDLRTERDHGKRMFDGAKNEPEIDPEAPENYKAAKTEYERLDQEYKRLDNLLTENGARTEQLKDKLETTINMRVLEVRNRFEFFMRQFQFEGEVSWTVDEDRRGRNVFKLFIKARKEGHRGTMEDVSVKARGGRVGKGVSGGEESLSSLLFALALLQNLSFTPGFIVLDEFDSALDENRKLKVFDLYVQELKRKLIILSPKSHEKQYLDRFSKALVVQHDSSIPFSKIVGLVMN